MHGTQVYVVDAGWEQATHLILQSAARGTDILAVLPDHPHSTIIYSRLLDAARRVGANIAPVYVDPLNPPAAIRRIVEAFGEARPTLAYINAAPSLAVEAAIAALLAARMGEPRAKLLLATWDVAHPYTILDLKPLLAVMEGLPRGLETIARLVHEKARRLAEVAAAAGLRETTVKKRLSRLRSMGLVEKKLNLYTPTAWLALYAALRGWKP